MNNVILRKCGTRGRSGLDHYAACSFVICRTIAMSIVEAGLTASAAKLKMAFPATQPFDRSKLFTNRSSPIWALAFFLVGDIYDYWLYFCLFFSSKEKSTTPK